VFFILHLCGCRRGGHRYSRRSIWCGVHRNRLLDDQVVFDVLHTGNGRSVMACGGLLSRSVHKAAELNDSLTVSTLTANDFTRRPAAAGRSSPFV